MKKLLITMMTTLVLVLAACNSPEAAPKDEHAGMDHGEHGSDSDMDMDMTELENELDEMFEIGDTLEIVDLYGRAAPSAQPTGAFYMLIVNGTDAEERLQSASIDACGTVELHEMIMDGDVMKMNEVEGGEIVIPAGDAVSLEPGGLHVMCIDKTGEFVAGDTVAVTLNFATAGTMTMDAEIRDIGGSMDHGDMDHGGGHDGEEMDHSEHGG